MHIYLYAFEYAYAYALAYLFYHFAFNCIANGKTAAHRTIVTDFQKKNFNQFHHFENLFLFWCS